MSASQSLGVAEAAAECLRRARDVRVDEGAVAALCREHASLEVPAWEQSLHFSDGTHRTANYVLVLDALNFCFWADPGQPRWVVSYRGEDYQGYWALAAALKRSIEEGVPLLEARFLAEVTLDDTRRILRGSGDVPLLEDRHRHLQEVGRVLLERYDGRFSNMVEACNRDAVDLAARVASELTSFNDVSEYDGLVVPILKRAQILAVDLHGTFAGRAWGDLARLDRLTAFADYKVPQVLRRLGILRYSDALANAVDTLAPIPAGDPREVEIRAATVHAVELIRRAMPGRPHSFEVDWFLWGLGQEHSSIELPGDEKPYHRTRTIYY